LIGGARTYPDVDAEFVVADTGAAAALIGHSDRAEQIVVGKAVG
jgi:hypothetical protein